MSEEIFESDKCPVQLRKLAGLHRLYESDKDFVEIHIYGKNDFKLKQSLDHNRPIVIPDEMIPKVFEWFKIKYPQIALIPDEVVFFSAKYYLYFQTHPDQYKKICNDVVETFMTE